MEKVTQNVPDTGCTDPDEFVNDLCIEAIEDEDDRAFPLGILSVVSLICSGAILTPSMNENNP